MCGGQWLLPRVREQRGGGGGDTKQEREEKETGKDKMEVEVM